jgi:indolepyruvate decarboxylase
MNVARYILQRFTQHGVNVLFGIPGTSCAAFFDEASAAGFQIILNSSELEAGYAADGYARHRGLALISVSNGVGTLSLVNPIAGAYVERSAVVVVNGGASLRELWHEKHRGVLFSHSTGRPFTDLEVLRQVTAFAARAETAFDAPALIDQALTIAIREQRPTYIEIPRDLWRSNCGEPAGRLDTRRVEVGTETELASRIAHRLGAASRPALLLGVEIGRYGLEADVSVLLQRTGIPWATTLLAKTVLPEDTPGFIGVYDSDLAPKPVRDVIEEADLLIALGCVFGVDHTHLVNRTFSNMVHAADGAVRIGDTPAERGELRALIRALVAGLPPLSEPSIESAVRVAAGPYPVRQRWTEPPPAGGGLTHEELFTEIDERLSNGWAVVVDTCLGSYPAADLAVRGSKAFVGNPVWLSIGHSVGAAVGFALASNQAVLVVCGDGGFQMIAQALSTLAKYALNVTVLVIDNGLYAIEQYLIDPAYFSDLAHPALPYVGLNRWDYPALAQSMGVPSTYAVMNCDELQQALDAAIANRGTVLISARVQQRDLPPENRAPMRA